MEQDAEQTVLRADLAEQSRWFDSLHYYCHLLFVCLHLEQTAAAESGRSLAFCP